jgi:hypothetical protein
MQLVPRDPARAPALAMSEDRTTSTLVPQAVGTTFYNTTDEAWASRAAALVGPEPMAVWLTPLAVSDGGFGRVPRIYVDCRRDRAIPPSLQQLMVAALPCPVVSLDTDHSPFYSAPGQLVVTLASIAAKA